MNQEAFKYKGRFAPSPTGPLHFGSLIAALASYLEARQEAGEWHIRIDDIDHLRCKAEYTKEILDMLEHLGFEWDGELIYQSQQIPDYERAIATLKNKQKIFQCLCSRKQLPAGPYPGTCRNKEINPNIKSSLRLMTDSVKIVFHDHLQGEISQDLPEEVGDFIILRGDGIIAYHLATVIDDAESGFTHIVRGLDLIDSTPRQIYLQRLLDLPTPEYYHLPIAVNKDGDKLSKQSHAKAVSYEGASSSLMRALKFLNQNPTEELNDATPDEILMWAIKHWNKEKIPSEKKIIIDE